MAGTIYITTTIPYVNARPHIGFALELVQADTLARYYRLTGNSVRFQTGTDDNALSNVLSARALGIPVQELVESNSAAFQRLAVALDLSADSFVRTSEPSHHSGVRKFLSSLEPDDIYAASYRGLYCPRCEDFYLERDVEGNRRRCPEHGTPLDDVEETNHFFRLSRYQNAVHHLISRGTIEVIPKRRETEVLRFIERGLRDFSISRNAARSAGWGVRFPGDPEQVVYVWVDALINYLTGLGCPEEDVRRRFWTDSSRKIHVIGKNVWKFHAVYWPALLLSAGLPVPDEIVAHGFLTEDGKKISKSAGTASDPEEFISSFGAEAVRYYLLAYVRPFDDTDFSVDRLDAVYRSDLANVLGNLCSRLSALCDTAGVPGVPAAKPPAPEGYHEHLERFRFDLAIAALWCELNRLNREIAEERPWENLRRGERDVVVERLTTWAVRLHAAAYWLAPLLPSTSASITQTLTAPHIKKCEPLFPRRR
ncbi:MAG: methionine--tRNA ligase [Gemmatimonadales bacterium]|jgi:methionyl-tRNA synthetase